MVFKPKYEKLYIEKSSPLHPPVDEIETLRDDLSNFIQPDKVLGPLLLRVSQASVYISSCMDTIPIMVTFYTHQLVKLGKKIGSIL